MSEIRQIWIRPIIGEHKPPDDQIWAIVEYMVGYCPTTRKYFNEMANLLKDSFPEVVLNDVGFGKVHTSSCCQSFTIVHWGGLIAKKNYKDWHMTVSWSHNHCFNSDEEKQVVAFEADRLVEELTKLTGNSIYKASQDYYY